MKQLMKETNDQSHPELFNMNPNDVYTETKLEEIKKQLNCKERTKYKLYSLDDNYCLFLASMNFTSIDDFINLEMATPRALNNTSKFFYNPISLTSTTRTFFDNLQTLHIYKDDDSLFENDPKIINRVYIPPVSYKEHCSFPRKFKQKVKKFLEKII